MLQKVLSRNVYLLVTQVSCDEGQEDYDFNIRNEDHFRLERQPLATQL